MATGVFYPSHVPVSALTNRPIIVGHVQKATPQFKCTKCQIILNSPLQAIDHFNNKDCLLETQKKHVSINNRNDNFTVVQNIKPLTEKLNRTVPVDPNGNPIFKCNICSCVFNSKYSTDQHFTGKKHLTKVEEIKTAPNPVSNMVTGYDLDCTICNASFNSQTSADQHYTGRKHAMALAEAGISAPLLKITNEAKTGYYKCTTCSITLTSKTQLDQHMSGLKHKLATVETKEENWRAYSDKQPCSSSQPQDFQCQTCDLVMNSKSQLQHHLISPKHKGMVALSKQGQQTFHSNTRGRGLKRPHTSGTMEQGNGLGRGRGLSTRGSWGGTGGGGRGISGGCGKSHRGGGRGAAFQHKSHTEKKFKPLLSGLNISEINSYQRPQQQQNNYQNNFQNNSFSSKITDGHSSGQPPPQNYFNNSQIGGVNQFQSF